MGDRWILMYGEAGETRWGSRVRSDYGRRRAPGDAIAAMLASEPFEVPALYKTVLVMRASSDPAEFEFEAAAHG